MQISNLQEAIDIAGRLNPQFRQLVMPIVECDGNRVSVDTKSPLYRIVLSYRNNIAEAELELASAADVKTFIGLAGEEISDTLGKVDVNDNRLSVSKEVKTLLSAAGWLVGCAIKFRMLVDKYSERLSEIGENRRKYLVVICPKQYEAIELLMAKDKLPSCHEEGQHIIGRHRYSLSGEGFRAESKFLYLIDREPLVKVYEGIDLIFCDKVDLRITKDSVLSIERNIKIEPIPTTVVVERRMLFEGEFKYELSLDADDKFDAERLRLFENHSTEFDPDCDDGLSLAKIKYGDEILTLANADHYGTWQARYFFGTLYPSYIEYINV